MTRLHGPGAPPVRSELTAGKTLSSNADERWIHSCSFTSPPECLAGMIVAAAVGQASRFSGAGLMTRAGDPVPASRGPQDALISVVIPALNEEPTLGATLAAVAGLGCRHEVIVVDGGSSDDTVAVAAAGDCRVLSAERGRGNQLRVGGVAACGEILWFLHADTLPPENAAELITAALADARVAGGYFRVVFDGQGRAGRFFAWLYSCVQLIGLCYGDSAFFARRDCYQRAGGFRPLPLFEDLDLRRRLLREGRFVRVPGRVTTSSRRFAGRSAPLMLARWACLQVLYWMGVSPHRLARFYVAIRSAP